MHKLLRDAERLVSSPLALWILVAVFVATGIVVSLRLPLYQGSDEGWHYAYVEHYALGRPLPDLNKHYTSGNITAPYWQTHEAAQPPLYYMLMGRIVALIPRGNLMQEQVLLTTLANEMYGNYLPADEGTLGTGHVLAGHLLRLIGVCAGVIVSLCAYAIVNRLTKRPYIALLTTALLALNPRFVMLSAAISNDMAVACTAALTLWLAVRMVTAEKRAHWASFLVLGFGAGISLLMKYSGAVIVAAVIAAVVVYIIQRRFSLRAFLLYGALCAAGALVVTLPFFIHNWNLYGDILAINRINSLMPGFATPRPIENTLHWLPFIIKTYFGHPGFTLLSGQVFTEVMFYLFLIGTAGAIWWVLRRHMRLSYLVVLMPLVVNTVAYYFWLASRDATQNMRFFSPTFIPITLGLAGGLLMFVPRRLRVTCAGLCALVLVVFTPATLLDMLRVMYPFPAYADAQTTQRLLKDSQPTRFENGIELLDVQLTNQRIENGQPVLLQMTWRTTRPLTISAHLMLDVRDDTGQTIASYYTGNTVRYSLVTHAWQVNRPVVESYSIPLPAIEGKLYDIYAGWTEANGKLVRPVGQSAVSVNVGVVRARLTIAQAPANEARTAAFVGLGNLLSTHVESDALVLRWRATAEPQHNYTVFVHGLDVQGRIIAQQDDLINPSAAYWFSGELLEQRVRVPGLGSAASIQVGVYDPAT